jgi:hypothetical protein
VLEPVSVADRALDGTSQALLRAIERGVQLIPVGISENQNVNISPCTSASTSASTAGTPKALTSTSARPA